MLREEDGGAMAEMAIGGVLVVLLITSIFDLGLYMILNMQLESGVRDGARYGLPEMFRQRARESRKFWIGSMTAC